MRGNNEASRFLESAGGKRHAAAVTPPAPIATPRRAADAVERAVVRLQPAGPAFYNRTKCNSCHNQNIPGFAITLAQRQGLKVDDTLAGHSMTATNTQWQNRREVVLLGDTTGGGFQPNSEYTLFEMAEAHMPPTLNSDALVLGLATRQLADGSWGIGADIRPALTGSAISSTALAMRALREYAPAGHRDEMNARVARAVSFLMQADPRDTQDRAFKLLGLVWSAQMPSMAPDAYATGQVLFALHAAKHPVTDAVYRKGADYLLRTQLEDGTWFVQTRAFGFQPYFETGFPHGRSQFISTVGTAWASADLTYTLEAGRQSQQQ